MYHDCFHQLIPCMQVFSDGFQPSWMLLEECQFKGSVQSKITLCGVCRSSGPSSVNTTWRVLIGTTA